MAKAPPLTAQEHVILFCTATVHNRESGTYTLTDSGRSTLRGILENAGLP